MAVVPEELVIFAKNKTLKDNRPFFSYIFRFPLYYFLDIFQFKFYIHGTRNVLKENEFPF